MSVYRSVSFEGTLKSPCPSGKTVFSSQIATTFPSPASNLTMKNIQRITLNTPAPTPQTGKFPEVFPEELFISKTSQAISIHHQICQSMMFQMENCQIAPFIALFDGFFLGKKCFLVIFATNSIARSTAEAPPVPWWQSDHDPSHVSWAQKLGSVNKSCDSHHLKDDPLLGGWAPT